MENYGITKSYGKTNLIIKHNVLPSDVELITKKI